MDLFENPDVTMVMCACTHVLPCIKAFLGLRQRFIVDGVHFIHFQGKITTGLVWTENILSVSNLSGLVWTGLMHHKAQSR